MIKHRKAILRKVDDIVRNHDREEPYITNAVMRIMMIIDDLDRPEKKNRSEDYSRGYNSGYIAGQRSQKLKT